MKDNHLAWLIVGINVFLWQMFGGSSSMFVAMLALLTYSWRSGGNPSPGSTVVNGAAMRRVRISSDEGRSWSAPARITPDDYPSCLFIDDAAYITYFVTPEDNPGGQRALKAVKIPIDWFYAS